MTRELKTHRDATYSREIVEEITLAMQKFLDVGMTSAEAQAATRAYAEMSAAETAARSQCEQGRLDRASDDFQGRMSRNDRRIR